MTPARYIIRACWLVLVLVKTVGLPPIDDLAVGALVDHAVEELMTQMAYRALHVAPRVESVCDAVEVLPSV